MSRREKEYSLNRSIVMKQTRYGDDIKEIYEYFIKPFGDAIIIQDGESTFRAAVEAFFQVQTRDVFFAKTRNDFKLPGMLVSQLDRVKVLIPGAGPRRVKRGDVLLVRTDMHMPNRIDIEFQDSDFQLSAVEYGVIKEYLKEVL